MTQKIKRLFIASATLTLFMVPSIASAHEVETTHSEAPSPSSTPKAEKVREAEKNLQDSLKRAKEQRQATINDKKADLKERLDDAKKKVCENHRSEINRIMENMDTRRQNAFSRITQVAEAAQKFVTDKNLTVANYDDLVAAVDAAKSAAEGAMESQKAIPELNCDGDHPRADVTDFKEKRADSIDAMKAYRDAVKELVKAIKVAAASNNGDVQ